MTLVPDPGFNYSALTALGMSAYGLTEVGEVLVAVDAINAAGASCDSWTATFLALAERLAAVSKESSDPITRRDTALRASQYYAQALFADGAPTPQRGDLRQAGKDRRLTSPRSDTTQETAEDG